jgi:hypothetical protein
MEEKEMNKQNAAPNQIRVRSNVKVGAVKYGPSL